MINSYQERAFHHRTVRSGLESSRRPAACGAIRTGLGTSITACAGFLRSVNGEME